MRKKIFRSILMVSVTVLLIGMAFLLGVLYNYFGNSLEDELHNEAGYLSVAIDENGPDILKRIDTDERITLVDGSGKVIYDNQADPSKMENHLEREEIAEALENGSGSAVRSSDTLGENTIYYAVRLDNGEVLRVSSTQHSIMSIIYSLLPHFIFVFVLMLALSAAAASHVAKKIIGPVNAIDLERPEDAKVYDELTPLLVKIKHQQTTIEEQLEEAKRQQKEFALITDNMQEGLLVIDENTDLLSYNRSALRLFNAEKAETGKSVYILSRKENFASAVETGLSGKHADIYMDVSDRICRVAVSPVTDSEGKTAGAVILITDETEKEKREEMRREFSANVSHELKTPLTSISGFAEILKEGMVKPKDTKKFAGRIFDEARRLISLVEDIIEISRLDEEKTDYKRENLSVSSMANQILNNLRPVAEKRGISLSYEGEDISIFTVRAVFEEILFNLCDNAVKYNKDGGSVLVKARKNGDMLEIKVKDTGIGIPENETEHIFERFYRVDKSHSRSIGGTGLGLSIVKHGVSCLKGSIEVQSVPGEGSCFTLTLPLA